MKDIFNLKKFIKVNSIDIIHAHGKGAGVISRILRILINKPLIYTFHGIHLKCHRWHKRLIYIIYEYLTGWIDSAKSWFRIVKKIMLKIKNISWKEINYY